MHEVVYVSFLLHQAVCITVDTSDMCFRTTGYWWKTLCCRI